MRISSPLPLFILFLLFPIRMFAATYPAASCNQGDIQAAINMASDGDIVTVPAGNCTWLNATSIANCGSPGITAGLCIPHSITLQGSGIGNTTIINNVCPGTCSENGNYLLIAYNPANPSANLPFRITGFTFNMNQNQSYGISLFSGNNVLTSIRIDHNRFINSYYGLDVYLAGTVYGVIDHNEFNDTQIFMLANNVWTWNNTTFQFGDANKMYIEDNTFVITTASLTCGQGIKAVARYNSYTYIAPGGVGLYPWFDNHGNEQSGVYACMGFEGYGNILISTTVSYGNSIRMYHHRGGEGLFFDNLVSLTINGVTENGLAILAQKEWDDSIDPTTNSEPQHVSNSYYWNNRASDNTLAVLSVANDIYSSTGFPPNGPGDYTETSSTTFTAAGPVQDPEVYAPATGEDACGTTAPPCPTYLISENVDMYTQGTFFNGTLGVGCGPLAAIPATCTTGVAYWATNQSCDSVSLANVGPNPASPIAGTLYKCTSTNNWTAYYAPYTYPHPLTLASAWPVTTSTTLSPGLNAALVYPDPVTPPHDPTIRICPGGSTSGGADIGVTIFDVSGRAVNSSDAFNFIGTPSQGEGAGQFECYEYKWTGHKASGVYFAVIHAKVSGTTVKAKLKFAVVR